MTINEAIASLGENAFTREEKIAWLSRLDSHITLLLGRYENLPPFAGYAPDTDGGQTLLMPAPFDEGYIHYLQAQMDYRNGEITRYNNAMGLFNGVMSAFENHCNREKMPRGRQFTYF